MSKLRPRLADHILARRHLIDGEECVVLHNSESGSLLKLEPRAFAIVSMADGTRDADGIALAASRDGSYRRMSEVLALLSALDEHGALVEGISSGPRANALERLTAQTMADGERLLARLPGHRFHCSGRGHCCGQYGSIVATQDDLLRASKAGLSTLVDDPEQRRVVLPLYGTTRRERLAMTLVNGRCLQLSEQRRCGLHERGGASAKPTACQSYPATLVDDGHEVRLSLNTECDCAFDAPDGGAGEPLFHGVGTVAELPRDITVRTLREQIALGETTTATREAVAAWSRLASEAVPAESIPLACVALAASLHNGALVSFATLEEADVGVTQQRLRQAVLMLAQTLTDAAAASASWRSQHDYTRLSRELARQAADGLRDPVAWERALRSETFAKDEAFAVRAALFGHHLLGNKPLATALTDLAAQLLVARSLGSMIADEPHPLARVMAMVRGLGS